MKAKNKSRKHIEKRQDSGLKKVIKAIYFVLFFWKKSPPVKKRECLHSPIQTRPLLSIPSPRPAPKFNPHFVLARIVPLREKTLKTFYDDFCQNHCWPVVLGLRHDFYFHYYFGFRVALIAVQGTFIIFERKQSPWGKYWTHRQIDLLEILDRAPDFTLGGIALEVPKEFKGNWEQNQSGLFQL